jgi:hypothetical protein
MTQSDEDGADLDNALRGKDDLDDSDEDYDEYPHAVPARRGAQGQRRREAVATLRDRVEQLFEEHDRGQAIPNVSGRRIAAGIPVITRDPEGKYHAELLPLITEGITRLTRLGVSLDINLVRPQTITHAIRWLLDGARVGGPESSRPPSFPPGTRVRLEREGLTVQLRTGKPCWISGNRFQYNVQMETEHGTHRLTSIRAPLRDDATIIGGQGDSAANTMPRESGKRPRSTRQSTRGAPPVKYGLSVNYGLSDDSEDDETNQDTETMTRKRARNDTESASNRATNNGHNRGDDGSGGTPHDKHDSRPPSYPPRARFQLRKNGRGGKLKKGAFGQLTTGVPMGNYYNDIYKYRYHAKMETGGKKTSFYPPLEDYITFISQHDDESPGRCGQDVNNSSTASVQEASQGGASAHTRSGEQDDDDNAPTAGQEQSQSGVSVLTEEDALSQAHEDGGNGIEAMVKSVTSVTQVKVTES